MIQTGVSHNLVFQSNILRGKRKMLEGMISVVYTYFGFCYIYSQAYKHLMLMCTFDNKNNNIKYIFLFPYQTSVAQHVFHYFLLTFSMIFRISIKRLMMSRYSSMVATMYSSGDTLFMIIWVSKMMNPILISKNTDKQSASLLW